MNLIEEASILEEKVEEAFIDMKISRKQQQKLFDEAELLKRNFPDIYAHSLRCCLLGKDAARYTGKFDFKISWSEENRFPDIRFYTKAIDPKILAYTAMTHDTGLVVGKADHHIHTYNMIRELFPFTSLVSLNHRMGEKRYVHDGRGLDEKSIRYSEYCASIFMVIDQFDTLTRPSSALTDEPIIVSGKHIIEILINNNKDHESLINKLYKKGVFK